MYDLKLEFTDNGIIFHENESIEGFPAAAQDVLLNLATAAGSDIMHADRGTELEQQALQTGTIISEAAGTHAANIAATDTVTFMQETVDTADEDSIADVSLTPVSFKNQKLKLNAIVTSIKGEIIGTSNNLTLEDE
jgi:hypothetical protein